VKKGDEVVDDKLLYTEDFRPRDGSTSEWTSLSRQAEAASRAAKFQSEHHILHEMSTAYMGPEAASQIEDEAGTTHAQAGAGLDDASPTVYLTLPIGCLIEEVILVDGHPPMPASSREMRMTQMTVDIFHLDQAQLLERGKFASLHAIVGAERPVFSGEPAQSGVYAGVVNVKQWALYQRLQGATKSSSRAGCVFFSGGACGCAMLPNDEGGEEASGVVGNVIRVTWKSEPDGRPFVNNPPGRDHIRFVLGGLVVVGRRCQEPLWRDASWLQQRIKKKLLLKDKLFKVTERAVESLDD